MLFVGTEEDDSGLHLAEESACELFSLRYSIVGWAGAVNSPYFPARYYCGVILISMQHVSVKKKKAILMYGFCGMENFGVLKMLNC